MPKSEIINSISESLYFSVSFSLPTPPIPPTASLLLGIEDLVVNSVALAFILQIDELMCQEFFGGGFRGASLSRGSYGVVDFFWSKANEKKP